MLTVVCGKEQDLATGDEPLLPVKGRGAVNVLRAVPHEITTVNDLGFDSSRAVVPELREHLGIQDIAIGFAYPADVESSDALRLRKFDAGFALVCLPRQRHSNLPPSALK